jgi:hypothetical protein
MESEIQLANEISRLILSKETDFNKIKNEVKIFDELLEETCRNFYEVKMDKEAPLFELCEALELGADNYDLSEAEFEEYIINLKTQINGMFGYIIK